MSYRITFRDWVLRTKLDAQNIFRYIRGVTREGTFLIPSSYKLVFHDEFENTDKWLAADYWWGQPYHPRVLTTWFDQNQINIIDEGVEFSAVVKPRYFPEIDTTIPNAIGCMRTNEGWKYGIFSFRAKLNAGTYLWPALWFGGIANWPPEIDLLEGYSDDTTDYHKNKNLQSNVHMSDGAGGNYAAGARKHKLPNHVTEDQVYYTMWWEKDFIKLYYNGYLVRHITDKEVLDKMTEAQQIIIGTGVQVGFNTDNISPMVVSRVAVYQK